MKAIKEYTTIQENGDLLLKGLPFEPGQKVEVLVLVEEAKIDLAKLKELFKTTQALPIAQAITEEEIRQEIEDYRAGK